MGAFSSQKTLYGDTARIPQVAEKIRQAFVNEGYEVRIEDPASGQRIFISKGGLLKAAVGARTALEVTMKPDKAGNIAFEAGVSVVKQQLVPTLITMFVFAPVVIAQVWGMVQQSKLDEKVLAIAERELYKH